MGSGRKSILGATSTALIVFGAVTAVFGCVALVSGRGTYEYAGEGITLGPLLVGCGLIQAIPGLIGYLWDRAHTDDGFKPTLGRGIIAAVAAFAGLAIDLGVFGVLRSVCFGGAAELARAPQSFHTVAVIGFGACVVSIALLVVFMGGIILMLRDDVALMDGE